MVTSHKINWEIKAFHIRRTTPKIQHQKHQTRRKLKVHGLHYCCIYGHLILPVSSSFQTICNKKNSQNHIYPTINQQHLKHFLFSVERLVVVAAANSFTYTGVCALLVSLLVLRAEVHCLFFAHLS